MSRLNGWHRLWILASTLYLLVVLAGAYVSFPGDSDVSRTEVLPYVSTRSLMLMRNEEQEQQWPEVVVDGVRFAVPSQLDETAAREFRDDYLQARRSALRSKRASHSILALAWWAVPSLLLLALGFGIAWVRRDFWREAP